MEIVVLASSSAGNCYHVTDGQTGLLLDCGLPWREVRRRMEFKTSALAGVLLTHEHGDHAKGAADAAKAGLDVYCSQGTASALGLSGHRVQIVSARRQVQIRTMAVMPFEAVHDTAEPLGFLVAGNDGDKLMYITDSAYCRYTFSGLTHIMAECNYSLDILDANVAAGTVPVELRNRLLHSHMSLDTLKGLLRANDLRRVREVWLLHLSDNNSDAERFRREIAALTGKPVYVAQK